MACAIVLGRKQRVTTINKTDVKFPLPVAPYGLSPPLKCLYQYWFGYYLLPVSA